MAKYEAPRVTFVGSDPKIPALAKACQRVARHAGRYAFYGADVNRRHAARFVALWQARNRRTRVLMSRVRRANAA